MTQDKHATMEIRLVVLQAVLLIVGILALVYQAVYLLVPKSQYVEIVILILVKFVIMVFNLVVLLDV